MLITVFWILAIIIVYTYFGYAFLLLILNGLKRILGMKKSLPSDAVLPETTILIAAYNECVVIDRKMQNTLAIDYPKELLTIMWITDGSDDGTPELLRKKYPSVEVLHQDKRRGKTAALNRAMNFIKTPFAVLCDANTMLDPGAVRKLLAPFSDERIGCVAGEKRIIQNAYDGPAGAGEGAYWQYESIIKKLESDFHTALAAAGELYAIRTSLFSRADEDSIIDDFVISLTIARKGYRIRYVPEAFAMEAPSANIREELKRKIRIASGGIQTLLRFPGLLNIFRYGFLSFEYISHKVLRWLVVPFTIPLILLANLLICMQQQWQLTLYFYIFLLQCAFYLLVVLGFIFEKRTTRWRFLFLPYYIIIMNYSQIAGLIRYFRKKHTVVWEKAQRA